MKSKHNSAEFYKRVESKVADFDVKGAVKLLCSEDSFAPTNLETIIKLKEKHPTPYRPLNLPPPPSEQECFQTVQLFSFQISIQPVSMLYNEKNQVRGFMHSRPKTLAHSSTITLFAYV